MSGPLTSLSDRLSNLRSPEKCPEIAIFTADGINDEHTSAIADVLKISKSIIKLWLDRNAITNKGANDIGDALKSNTSIQYLNMSANQMTFEGAMAIFRGLKVNRSLITLLLNNNSLISDAAVAEQRHLWIGLQFNKSLQTLSLADNRMTDQTLLALCKGLSSNRTLTSLNLAGNAFTGRDLAPTMLQGTSAIFDYSLLGFGRQKRRLRGAFGQGKEIGSIAGAQRQVLGRGLSFFFVHPAHGATGPSTLRMVFQRPLCPSLAS